MTTTPPAGPGLPPIGDERIEAIERAVFSRIADAKSEQVRRRTRQRRWWVGGVSAAAVVVVAAIIAPYIPVGGMSTSGSASSTADGPTMLEGGTVQLDPGSGGVPFSGADESATAVVGDATGDSSAITLDGGREIATTASAEVIVTDVADAAKTIGADAEARGGYVETANVDASGAARDQAEADSDAQVEPYPYHGGDGGFITVRVPAGELTAAIDALDAVGEVTSSSIGRQDVTDQAIDLRARVAASEASVARLTELIGQAESVADLLTAEKALAERQATLDADRQQLESLENQVSLSTLSVQLSPETTVVQADPAGFGDGIAAGWNGLIATLNGIVIAFGFLLPWIVVVGIVGAIVWAIRRAVRRNRQKRLAADPGE